MLSRNNNKLLIHKLEPKKQRFAIRKISVGVASVLIGFTFAGFSGVSADEATTTTKDHLKTEATAESSSVPTKEVELTSSTEAPTKEAELTSNDEAPAQEAETTSVADDKAQVAEDTKEQALAEAVTAEENSEPTTSAEKQTVAPADENEASETQTFNVEKQAEPQAKVDLTDSKVAYAAAPTQAQDQQEEGFSVTDPDYSKYKYGETNLQELIEKFGIDYKNSEYVFQWIASTDGESGIIFTVDRGRDANGNVILTNEGKFNAYEYYMHEVKVQVGSKLEWHWYGSKEVPVYETEVKQDSDGKVVIKPGTTRPPRLHLGNIINDESKNAIAVDHFYANDGTTYLPIFVGGHSGVETNSGNGYGVLSIYTPQVVEQKATIDNGKVYKTQTGLTGQHYTTGIPKNAKVEEGKFLYAENSQGTMSEFHKGIVLVNDYHDGAIVEYKELDNQGTMDVTIYKETLWGYIRVYGKRMKVGEQDEYENITIANPYVQQTTDITYEYRTLGSVKLYDENGNYLGRRYQYVNDANDAAKASLPKVREKFTQGDIEYTLVTKEDLPSDLSRSIKYIYRGIETKVTHDTYTLTTKFVDEDGNELKAAEPQTITWTTTTKRDIHTNEIISQTSVPSAASYMAVNSPVIAGYYATTPGLGSRKAEQKNVTQKIVYRKLGNIIAKDSQGNVLTKVHYANDANDATKIKEIVAPTIKDYHVKSEVVQPSDPGQDTVLNYGKDIQDAQIKYWDETAHKYITDDQGNDLETIETGAHNTKISHKKVAEQIHALEAKGYEYDFANQGFSTVYFDDDDSKTQTFTVKLMHGTTMKPESKQITREIIIHHPNQQEEPKKQTATLTRNVTRDKVTGDVIETGEWNPGNFDEVEVTPHKGYKIDETPDEIQNGKVVGKTVKADEEDGKKIDVKYIPLEQHALVEYVDDNTGKLLDKEDIQGVTDAAIEHSNTEKITAYQDKGYELVSDELAKAEDPHFNAEDESQVFKVHLKHRLDATELEKTVTRTIIAEVPNGKQGETQTAKFTRTGTKDLVTGDIAWNDWSPAQEFDAYTAPVVPGYTPSKATVERATVTADDKDTTITITYTANDQKVMIKYVDVDDNNKEVKSQSLDGVTDQTVDTKYEVPANYELVAGQDLPKTVTFKANDNEPIIVKVQHKKVSVEVGEKGTQNVVTRKITVHKPDGTTQDASQTATFTRTGTKDLVTGKPIWNAWSPAQKLDAYTAPKVDGYTADKTVEQLTVNANDKIAPVDIYYTADAQEVMIKYIDVDENDKEIKSQPLDGVTDQTVDVNYEVPANYELVAGQDLPDKVTFKANDNESIIVKVQHKHQDVTDEYKNDAHKQDKVDHTVKRIITIEHPHATDETTIQNLHFTRQVTRDMATGQDTFGEWIPENVDFFEEFAVPTLASDKGYTPEKTKVDRLEHITGDTDNQHVTVKFTANDQKAHVHYIDDTTGKKLEVVHVTGKTDEPIKHDSKAKVQGYLDKGYELVSDDFAKAGKPSYNAEDEDQHFEVHLKHAIKDVTDQHAEHEVKHTVNRHIIIKHPHAADETHTQSIHFKRQVTRDMATGHDTFGEWIPESADFFEEFAVPTLASDKGYTPKKTKVDRLEHITGNTEDKREIVEFAANDQKAHVHYIDDTTGKKLEVVHVTGKTDEPIKHDSKAKVQGYLDKGYELVSDDFAKAGKPSYNAEDEEQHFEVHLKHGQKDVTDEYKQDDNRKDHVDRTIKREIIINHPKEDPESYVQTAHFTRNVTRDTVTGEDKPGEWIPEENDFFEEVPVSLKDSDKGYTPEKTKVDRLENISADTPNQKEVVEFTPNEQHALVKYVDDSTGTLLDEEDIQGVTDAAIEHTNDEKIAAYQAKGYELVSDELADENDPHFNAEDEAQVYTVHLKHGSKVVKADPSNADSQKEVKRTIIVNAPDGTKTTKVQKVVFTRDGSKDLVTGEISYPDWDEIATKAFSQDDVPQYLGYTSMVAGRKQTTIAAQNVRPTDADQVIEVSYVARPSQQVITYQDENGNQIGTQVITGHTDETVKLVPVLPDGWELLDPDSLPENVTFAPEENPVLVITVKRTVTEDSAKTEKDVENTEVAKQEVVNDTTDVTTDEKNETTLPQMGESDSETLAFSLLGLVTAAFSLFYFGKERRKTDN
ncbi:YSIRK-type signal peptide-containing protein [Lactobacillus sp. AN1001]